MSKQIGTYPIQPELLLDMLEIPPARRITELGRLAGQMRHLKPHGFTDYLLGKQMQQALPPNLTAFLIRVMSEMVLLMLALASDQHLSAFDTGTAAG
ncbi:hypothetical protein D3C78_1393110 [compost metagenome]